MNAVVLAIDQGTTGSRAAAFDAAGRLIALAYREVPIHYPRPGWVEQDPLDIWHTVADCIAEVLRHRAVSGRPIAALGITNQRETTVVWDRSIGRPLHPAIVWQCRRTAERCEELRESGYEDFLRKRTGLVADAYFSASKMEWLLRHVPGARAGAARGEVLLGTVDAWLAWNLTGGAAHVTDYSNASRTMLLNLRSLEWDPDLLAVFGVPEAALPEVRPTSGEFGVTAAGGPLPGGIPIRSLVGDQQAALFGQACFIPGMVKNTYGTGCFVLMHTGAHAPISQAGLLTTVAWGLGSRVEYALEGSVFVAGAVVRWLRDGLGIIDKPSEVEALAREVADTGGVYLVPAFAGLGAPYWDMQARGTIVGLTAGTTRSHLARAALEAIAFQTCDVVNLMNQEAGIPVESLRADGGAAANDLLLQIQADLLGIAVERPTVHETTARGAAYLAGLAAGLWDMEVLTRAWQLDRAFAPRLGVEERGARYRQWQRAVERAGGWAVAEPA